MYCLNCCYLYIFCQVLLIRLVVSQNITKLIKSALYGMIDIDDKNQICDEKEIIGPRFALDENPYLIANGCGPIDFTLVEPFGLYKCCNGHDLCYSICGSDFNFCESYFSKCLQEICEEQQDMNLKGNCTEMSETFSTMTSFFGRSFHVDSQKESCKCFNTKDEVKAQYKDQLHGFVKRQHILYNVDQMLTVYEGREPELEFKIVRDFGSSFIKFDNINSIIY